MNIPNVHPADELAAIREEIKQLEQREMALRSILLVADDAGRNGDQYRAYIQASTRESIDKAAMIAALGREVVAPFIKASNVQTLKVARKENAEQA